MQKPAEATVAQPLWRTNEFVFRFRTNTDKWFYDLETSTDNIVWKREFFYVTNGMTIWDTNHPKLPKKFFRVRGYP